MHASSQTAQTQRGSEGISVRRHLAWAVILLVWSLTLSLSHSYGGIRHDARLYTLQALAHLHPDSLSHDVFLHFGSQDQYTLFSWLYAAVISWLGTEPAAAFLTLLMQLAFLAGALLLARKVVSPTLALLGLTVLLAVPGWYGSGTIFSCIEGFVTPRMGAEALVLCGLAAALSARNRLAFALMSAGMLLHPVMAAAGFVAWACLHAAIPRPRLAVVVSAAGVIVLMAAALLLPLGPFRRYDPEWFELVQLRNTNVFVTSWTLQDWANAVVTLATLAVGVVTLSPGRSRTLCVVALVTSLAGLALTLIACDLLHLVLFTQLQAWRWLWLGNAVAALLLPAIGLAGWQRGFAGKATVLILVTAWIFGLDPLSLYVALGAISCATVARYLPTNLARLVFYGACGLLVLAVAARLAWNSVFLESFYIDPIIPAWMRDTAAFVRDGTLPVAFVLLALVLASQPRAAVALLALVALAIVAAVAVLPVTWAGWTKEQFPPALVARFAPWRALIPPGAKVLWPEAPVYTWLLLERPNYLSGAQTPGLLFSRPAAMEIRRRALALGNIFPPAGFLQLGGAGMPLSPSQDQIERACKTREFPFVVTDKHLSWPALAEVPKGIWHSSPGLRLYRCADQPESLQ